MKLKKLTSEDILTVMDALELAGEKELRDAFRAVYDAVLVDGTKKVTVEA